MDKLQQLQQTPYHVVYNIVYTMQLTCNYIQLISTSDFHTHSYATNKMPTWFFIHLSMDDVC
jgi:hypothetical protein